MLRSFAPAIALAPLAAFSLVAFTAVGSPAHAAVAPAPSALPSVVTPLPNPSAPVTAAPASDTPPPTATPLAAAPGSALIVNSGSTNFNGYQIALAPDGHATMTVGSAASTATVARPQTRWLFLKLAQFAPLSALNVNHCFKSVSFGTSTFVVFGGVRSPDLSCGGDADVRELARTIGVIVKALGVTPTPRHRLDAM